MKRVVDWPRYLKLKRLKGGRDAYYWEPHKWDKAAGFTLPAERLGSDYAAARDRAIILRAPALES